MAKLALVAFTCYSLTGVGPTQATPMHGNRMLPGTNPLQQQIQLNMVPFPELDYYPLLVSLPEPEPPQPEQQQQPPPEPPPLPLPQLKELYPTDQMLYNLRMCESTDNYGAHLVWGTQWESTAMGAYQFEQDTWNSTASRNAPHLVGVKPHLASPQDQDAMARYLFNERGRQPWPVCGRRI